MRADDGYQHSQKQEDDTGEDEQYDPAARSLLLIPIWGVGVIGRILFKMQGLAAVGAMGPTGLYRAAAVGADMVIAIPTVGAGAQMGGKRSMTPGTGAAHLVGAHKEVDDQADAKGDEGRYQGPGEGWHASAGSILIHIYPDDEGNGDHSGQQQKEGENAQDNSQKKTDHTKILLYLPLQ